MNWLKDSPSSILSNHSQNFPQLPLCQWVSTTIAFRRQLCLAPSSKHLRFLQMNWLSMAFAFLNRFLDLAEAIDDPQGADALENADFENTDIPHDFHLPSKHFVDGERARALLDRLNPLAAAAITARARTACLRALERGHVAEAEDEFCVLTPR